MIGGADAGRPRASILAAVVIPALLVALTGGLIAIDRPVKAEPGGAAARYLPADGASARYRTEDGSVRAVEHARSIGVEGALVGPDPVSAAVIGGFAGDGVSSAHFWREITTTPDGHYNDLYVLGEDGLRQVASWGGVIGFTFEPGLLLLPRDAAPGAEWSSSGSALGDGALIYESEFRASAADEALTGADGETFTPPEDCLRLDGTLTLEQPGEGVLLTTTDTSVWCPGQGHVFSHGEQNGTVVGSVLVPASEPLPPIADGAEAGDGTSGGPTQGPGARETLDAVVVDPFFGESVKQASVTTPPAVTAGGLVVTANEHGDDLLAWRLEGDRAVQAWGAHPGGAIATVSSVGELVVAATEDRVVRAYDEHGRRLWSWEGDDLALATAIRAPGSDDVLVATRGGTLARLDAEGGREVWSTGLGADARGDFVAVGDTVVVADERGRLNGLDAGTGELLWRKDLGMSEALSAADSEGGPLAYLGTADSEILAIDGRTGEVVWEAAVTGLLRSVSASENGVAVATDEETVWFSARDGSELWTSPGAAAVLAAADDRVVAMSADAVVLRNADGEEAAEWTLPEREDPAAPHLLLSGDDAVVVGPSLQLWRMGLG